MNDKFSTIEKIGGWISTLLLGKTKEIIIRTDEKVQGLLTATSNIQKSIDDFRTSIATHGSDIKALQIHTRYGVNNSPTTPNANGEKLLTDAGFYKTVFPALEKEIFTLMDSEGLRTLYDYEKGAEKVLDRLKNNPAMDCLKEHAVNHPDESLELIFKIASWIIRDKYAEYKAIQESQRK